MIGLLFLLFTSAAGAMAAARWLRGLALVDRVAVGLSASVVAACWLPWLMRWRFGIACAVGLLASASAAALLLATRPAGPGHARRRLAGLRPAQALWLLAIALLVGKWFHVGSLHEIEGDWHASGISWEDQSWHRTLAASFLHSGNLGRLEYPTFAGWPLGYPFLPDALAAALDAGGLGLSAFFWSGWWAGAILLFGLWRLAARWSGGAARGAAWLAAPFFLLSGGLGFADLLGSAAGGTPFAEALWAWDYANEWQLDLHYHNMLTGVLLPMRTTLFGMAAGFGLLLWADAELARPRWRAATLCGAGAVAGLLPWISMHAFVAVAWFAALRGLWALRTAPPGQRAGRVRVGLLAAAAAAAVAMPQLGWTAGQVGMSAPFLRWHLGGMSAAPNPLEWARYIVWNTGLTLPLAACGWSAVSRRGRAALAPLLLAFVWINVAAFQPFVYDNVKQWAWAQAAASTLAAAACGRLWARGAAGRCTAAAAAALLCASGALSWGRELRTDYRILAADEVAFGGQVLRVTGPEDVVLSADRLNHPVPVVSGRRLVCGFNGWLSQHGVPHELRAAEVEAVYLGAPRARAVLKRYGVDWIVLGPPERDAYPGLDETALRALSQWEFAAGEYRLFKVAP